MGGVGNCVFHRVGWKEMEGPHVLMIKATTWEEPAKLVAPAMCKGAPAALLAARGDPHRRTSPLMACPSSGASPTTVQLLPVRLFACAWGGHLQEEASSPSHGDPPDMGHLLGGPWGAGALSNENLN